MTVSPPSAPQITPRDDEFHFDQLSDRWWITETAWFSFSRPDLGLGGWLYTMVRPNIGTVAGGCWIWDASAALPWEVLYSANYTALQLPRDQKLSDISLPSGVRMKTLVPLSSYQLGYEDEGRLSLDLRFDAVMPPRPLVKAGTAFGSLSHFDQFGRVHGTLTLHGQEIAIDCLSMRDRSWGPRPEHRPSQSAYVTGMADPGHGFLALTTGNGAESPVTAGFHIEGGVTADLVRGTRRVRRCPHAHWVEHIIIEAEDSLGRILHAQGRRLSGILINRHSFIDSNGLIEWQIGSRKGHGEDQDMWPVHDWSAARRRQRAAL